MSNYKQLDVWNRAMDLVEHCYRLTSDFPGDERFGLTSQMRRAAVSMPSNIAEGHDRGRVKAYANHVSIALGSHAELETCLELAIRLGFVTSVRSEELRSLNAAVGQMLNRLHQSLKAAAKRAARDE